MTVDKPANNEAVNQSSGSDSSIKDISQPQRHKLDAALQWLLNASSIVVIGGGIGWLVGLSVSPVVANVVTVIITAAATLVATMGGWNRGASEANKPEEAANAKAGEVSDSLSKADKAETANTVQDKSENKLAIFSRFLRMAAPLPFALLLIGIVIGSIEGLQARNQSWFGSNLSYEVEKWTEQGMPKAEVVRRLFEREHPYTPYIQPWLWLTTTLPISPSVVLTNPQVTVSNPISTEVQMWVDLGLEQTQVVSRLFELKYSSLTTTSPATSYQSIPEVPRDIDKTAGLNTGSGNTQITSEACSFYRNKSWEKLKKLLEVQDRLNSIIDDQKNQNELLSQIFQFLCR